MAYVHLSVFRAIAVYRAVGLGVLALVLAAGFVPALAQDAAPAAPATDDQAAAPAASGGAAKPADAGKGTFWVKLCDKMQFPDPAAKDPKTAKPIDKQVCVTQHESFDANSGQLMVSSAVREVEGADKKGLLVTVPLGMVVQAGLGVFFDDEKDPKKVIKLNYDYCLPSGCTAEVEATPDILVQMGKAKVMNVVAISLQGARAGFKVPMGGFATAIAGNPTDTAKFLNARKARLMQLRERLIAKQQAAQTAAGEALKGIQENAAAAAKDAGTAAPVDPNAAQTTTGN